MPQILGYTQDMPPASGYKEIKWTSGVPKRGGSGLAMFAVVGAAMVPFGILTCLNYKRYWYLRREQNDTRLSMMPFYLAETDRRMLRQKRAVMEKEREVLSDVPGWEEGTWFGEPIYKTIPADKWIIPRTEEFFLLTRRDIYHSWLFERHFH